MNPQSGQRTRVWDLPTRLFHWLLATLAVAMVVTAKIGADALEWHARFGYAIGSLLMFRVCWGFVGGHWSRFASFPPSLRRARAYMRGGPSGAGHNPLGAFSIYALLLFLAVQVATGLFSRTKEDFAGPLSVLVSNATAHFATGYHKGVGQFVLISWVALHIAAVAFHSWRGKAIVSAMWDGDKPLDAAPSRDDLRSRVLAAIVLSLCSLVMWGIVRLGG